jgi:hypothetical protein
LKNPFSASELYANENKNKNKWEEISSTTPKFYYFSDFKAASECLFDDEIWTLVIKCESECFIVVVYLHVVNHFTQNKISCFSLFVGKAHTHLFA